VVLQIENVRDIIAGISMLAALCCVKKLLFENSRAGRQLLFRGFFFFFISDFIRLQDMPMLLSIIIRIPAVLSDHSMLYSGLATDTHLPGYQASKRKYRKPDYTFLCL